MKNIFGLLLIVIGIVLGCYLGIWVMLVGGIIQFINALQPVSASGLAWGIVRVMCSGAVGWLSFFVLCGMGAAMLD